MTGIHHITAIAGRTATNIAFYTQVLGLRLVKKTVNFDDPGTYHLYYGDEEGSPGTILTFFPWEHASPGRAGVGLTQETAFRIPVESIGYWTHRLVEKGVPHGMPEKRFGETRLAFSDPDGTGLALVGDSSASARTAWSQGGIPDEHAIQGFHSAGLLLAKVQPTADVLQTILGFHIAGSEGSFARFAASHKGKGAFIDLREAGDFLQGRMGRGSVHHIAFRARDDAHQAEMAAKVRSLGLQPTEQIDREYFRSVYFREPGGILFELATDAPGFAVDEPLAELGTHLRLPEFLEPRRSSIEAALPPLGDRP
jgi:glyoxalase family protein